MNVRENPETFLHGEGLGPTTLSKMKKSVRTTEELFDQY